MIYVLSYLNLKIFKQVELLMCSSWYNLFVKSLQIKLTKNSSLFYQLLATYYEAPQQYVLNPFFFISKQTQKSPIKEKHL